MLMQGWVKYLSPQNTSGVSGENSVAAKSKIIDRLVNGDQFFKRKNTTAENIKCFQTAPVVTFKCPYAQTFKFDLKLCHLNNVFRLNLLCDPRAHLALEEDI